MTAAAPDTMRATTAQKLLNAGFKLAAAPEDGTCKCGHLFGPHQFTASFGSPLEGGLYYCQDYPDCPCTGTWGPTCPEELKNRYRDNGDDL